MQKLLLADDDEEEYNQPKENLKESVIDSMCELLSELETRCVHPTFLKLLVKVFGYVLCPTEFHYTKLFKCIFKIF